eukprot:NODE_380_length_9674_cov_0.149452.p2 type:complete len:441 gc:universal NODE_380_length_9674_cov_0.149452:7743-9065(+)
MFYLISLAASHQLNAQLSGNKIAVIGGGAAGTSFAYHLSEIVNHSPKVKIDLFEANNKIGGRVDSILVPFENNTIVVDFGASIFVDSNPIMYNASKRFQLSFLEGGSSSFGFYDGSNFTFESSRYSWLTKLRMAWRYGLSLIKGPKLGDEAAARYSRIYDQETFHTIDGLIDALNLWDTLNSTARSYLHDLNPDYLNEVADVTSLVNYGRNIDQIHSLGCLVGMLSDNSYTINGGNDLIFRNFANHSSASINYKSKVTKIMASNNTYSLVINNTVHSGYDFVVLAGGLLDQSNLELDFKTSYIPDVEYYRIYVTVVVGLINPAFFNKKDVVDSIYCTRDNCPFTSISLIRKGKVNNVYKMFSPTYLSSHLKSQIFLNVDQMIEKSYYSYPKLHPNPEIINIEISKNLFYSSSFEPILSTMETAAVSGKNIAKIISQRLKL